MDWDDVRHFLALARTGSIRAAGASIGVSHSTVARRVEALEEKLAARLFDRSRDGYTLTEAGEQMLPRAERIEQEMSALERGVVGRDERLAGSVSITCCDTYVSDLVLRQLTPFCARHPDIELSINADGRLFDLAKREADIAIRVKPVGEQPPGYLVGRRIAPLRMASYVAMDHAERLDPALGGADARWVAFDDRNIQRLLVARSGYPDLPLWGSFTSIALMIQAAKVGLGLIMLPVYIGDQVPGLRRLTDTDLGQIGELWLLYHPDLRDNARIQATRSEIREAFATHRDLFEGTRFVDAPGGPEIAPNGPSGGRVP